MFRGVTLGCESDSPGVSSRGGSRCLREHLLASVVRLRGRLVRGLDVTLASLSGLVTVLAFWTAVAVPFFYLPILVSGFRTRQEVGVFVVLLAVNVVALRVGHQYHHGTPLQD